MKREPRNRVVCVRLTEAEHEALLRLGGPTAALRRLLASASAPAVQPAQSVSITVASPRTSMWWNDGTFGGTWPDLATA